MSGEINISMMKSMENYLRKLKEKEKRENLSSISFISVLRLLKRCLIQMWQQIIK